MEGEETGGGGRKKRRAGRKGHASRAREDTMEGSLSSLEDWAPADDEGASGVPTTTTTSTVTNSTPPSSSGGRQGHLSRPLARTPTGQFFGLGRHRR